MSILNKSLVIFALITCPVLAFGGQSTSGAQRDYQSTQGVERSTAGPAIPVLKSSADLDRYMAAVPMDKSPLGKLTPDARQRFIASLKFNEKGLTSFDYSDLEAELTPKEISDVVRLFGVEQMLLPGGSSVHSNGNRDSRVSPNMICLKGYMCVDKGTCWEETRACCTSNC